MAKYDESGQGYRKALKLARDDFESLVIEEKTLEARTARVRDRIVNLRKTITALSALCDEPANVDALGITEACWTVMSTASESLTTADVEARIAELGFDMSSHKNVTASIMAVLNRFANAGRITKSLVTGQKGDEKICWHLNR